MRTTMGLLGLIAVSMDKQFLRSHRILQNFSVRLSLDSKKENYQEPVGTKSSGFNSQKPYEIKRRNMTRF